MKKFWKHAAVSVQEDGFTITLDGRPLRTPARNALILQNAALAEAVAAEWNAQGDEVNPASMPITGLANATLDLVNPDSTAFAAPIAAYAVSDLLCYRDARDPILLAEQAAAWNPILNWAEQRFAIDFIITRGVLPVDQPAATITALQSATFALPSSHLAALAPLVTISGSLVSALAAIEKALDAEEIWKAVALDDLYQERRWGEDAEATIMLNQRRQDWQNAIRYLDLVRAA